MKKYSKRELNQHSGRILREIEETGEPALIEPGNGRGGKSFIISPAPETPYERLKAAGKIRPAIRKGFPRPVTDYDGDFDELMHEMRADWGEER
ncbi:type II toxin-antitoxin system Phd/YefM family antitoxin [Nesterenkonia ebinurensis]|uniref:type II toxin-antitoxin system Phd/YefM family antitoxin n=1 Tax=Nesterenkonia ebinurensis TaxID=2608252 RepID=UPI00123E089B|nr:type II toxin-antitoxin system Phd/YefM family antitoxin [Nesterenkonia ebinurensis]